MALARGLITMNLTDIKPFLIHRFKSEGDLIKAITKVSYNFTAAREDVNDYLLDERLVAAYAAFYLTTNYPKFSHCMEYLKDYKETLQNSELIDIGAGPGTFLFAIGEYFDWNISTLYGIETSHLMKKQAAKIKEGLFPDKNIEIVSSSNIIPKKKKNRIVIFTHSVNEMGVERAIEYIKDLDPDGIMFIEPGTKSFFQEYLVLREKLIESGFNCHYPCPTNNACPMKDKDDWCHQYIRVNHDPEIARLSQLVSINRVWQPMTLGLYLKGPLVSGVNARIIRTYPETKFSLGWDLCHESNKLTFVEVIKKDYDKNQVKVLSKYLAGKKVEFSIKKELTDRLRIKVEGEIG
jgi:ribosomal protein RSM22 (predicted rRNA methylase)